MEAIDWIKIKVSLHVYQETVICIIYAEMFHLFSAI